MLSVTTLNFPKSELRVKCSLDYASERQAATQNLSPQVNMINSELFEVCLLNANITGGSRRQIRCHRNQISK